MWLAPLLDGRCLREYPPHVDYKSEEIYKQHDTPLGYLKTHIIGFRFRFSLIWENSLCTETQWEYLRIIVNKKQVVSFRPFPDRYYDSEFTVQIVGGMSNLKPFRYVTMGYKGNIELVTVTPVQTIPAWVESRS